MHALAPMPTSTISSHRFVVHPQNTHHALGSEPTCAGMCAQVQALRSAGEFPRLIWKDTAPQHFQTTFGEYPEDKPKPPFECGPVGLTSTPQPGADKWRLREDHSVEVLFPEFATVAEGGWRNKARLFLLCFKLNFNVIRIIAEQNRTTLQIFVTLLS